MKRTAKRIAAEICATRQLKRQAVASIPNDQLYLMLEQNGYIWDSKAGSWKPGSKTIFQDQHGVASGVVRLRVMAHPDDVARTVQLLAKCPGLRLVETSMEYPNRRGAGVRVYLTCQL